jgi:hypothetical protein
VIEECERQAEAVLAAVPSWLWDGETLPVPIEVIADTHFGLLVRDVDAMTSAPGCPELEPEQSLSGLLLTDRGEIWVNAAEAREWPPRRRFTIGHELGHWVMHRESHSAVFCRSTTLDRETGASPPAPEAPEPLEGGRSASAIAGIEDEASAFAAALLMPAHLVRREYERDPTFERLCARFDASGAAMGRRLHAVIPRRGQRPRE